MSNQKLKRMNKNLVLLVVLLLLSAAAYFIYDKARVQNKMSSLSAERDFTVDSAEEINKIVLTRKDGKPLHFEKRNGKEWYINEKYKADDVVVGYMVQVLTKAKMKSIPSKNADATLKNYIKNKGILVEVYGKTGELLKKIHIGSDMQGGEGTYMLLDGYEQFYAVELPNLGGALRSRFEQPMERYRDKFIYRDAIETIQSLKVEYHGDPNASYIIRLKGTEYEIKPAVATVPEMKAEANQNKIKTYLNFFDELGAELLYNHYEKRDSLEKTLPFCTITMEKKDKTVKTYRFWNYEKTVYQAEEKDQAIEDIHIGRYFVNTGEDLFTVQSGVFGKIFAAYPYFY